MPATLPRARGRRPSTSRATATSSAPPNTIRAAPTATGDAAGPMAWAVPVVPKQTAARRTWRRGRMVVHLFHNSTQRSSLARARRRGRAHRRTTAGRHGAGLRGSVQFGGPEVAQRGGVGVVAQLHVQARRRVVDRPDLLDLLDVHAGDRGDLVQLGLALELHGELVADATDLAGLRRDVRGKADGTGGVVEAALDRLTDPQRGVGGEAEALAPVELLRRTDQPEHALLNEIVQRQAMALVPAGDREDEAQGGIDEPGLRPEIPALDA